MSLNQEDYEGQSVLILGRGKHCSSEVPMMMVIVMVIWLDRVDDVFGYYLCFNFQETQLLKQRITSSNQQIIFTWSVGHGCGWLGQLITLVT